MNARLAQALLGVALIVSALAALSGLESCRGRRGEDQSNVERGRAEANEAQARAKDAEITNLQAQHAAAQQAVANLKAEAQNLRQRLVPVPPSHAPVVPAGDPGGSGVGDGRDELIAKLDEVIEAQDNFIKGQKTEIAALVISRDAWKATAEAREREAAGLRIALDAQKHVTSAGRWRGRIEGFAAGVALGYVGGR